MSENTTKTSLNQLKNWFKTGSKPTQAQFWAWLDSFWHKDEEIPQDKIKGLSDSLEAKADADQLDNKANKDASGLSDEQKQAWKQALDVGELPSNIATIDETGENVSKLGNVYTKTKTDELLREKMDIPKEQGTTTEAPFVVGVNANNESYKLPAGDLGKNLGNTDLRVPARASRVLDITGADLAFRGLKSAQGDASFNKRPKLKSDGTWGQVDENTMLKEDFLKVIPLMNSTEKINWMKQWTGQYSNAAPSVSAVVMPVVEKTNASIEITLYGRNLYFDPEFTSIRYRPKTNANAWHDAIRWRNINSNAIEVVIDLNNTQAGEEYIFELRHQNYLYTTDTGVFVVDRFQRENIGNLSWTNAKKDYADSLLTTSRVGNTISHFQISRQGSTGRNQDGQLVSVWKSGKVLPKERDGIVILGFDVNYKTGGWEFPQSWDYFGVAEYIQNEEFTPENLIRSFKTKIGTGYQAHNNGQRWTSHNGLMNGHTGQMIVIKRGLSIQTIVQIEGQVNSKNERLMQNVDLAVMLQLNGRYLSEKKVGDYTLQEVILI